jgi:predicted CoA-binding protein
MTPHDDAGIAEILRTTRTIALVGWSPDPDRASHRVARFLAARGYRVIPVNPGHAGQVALGETVRASLADISEPVDLVDIFRRSDAVLPVVRQALAALPGLRTIWMQLGVENAEAAALAEARGLNVVQNRCPTIEIRRLGL